MKKALYLILFLLLPSVCFALACFPEAEGYGTDTVGGRGGTIYRVTNTNNSGSGSLREAVEASGARIVVFTTGGTITLSSNLTIGNPYITIAGQTAPGGGITLKGYGLIVATHDVIVRYLTVRGGSDAIACQKNDPDSIYNVVIDHCSISWSTDENLTSWYNPKDITWSRNMTYEGLQNHSMGMMMGGYWDEEGGDKSNPAQDFSIHHNFGAHNNDRNGPYLRGGGYCDIVNNIFYNPGANNFAYAPFEATILLKVNLVKNYFKRGPAGGGSNGCWRASDYRQTGGAGCETYVEGNYHSTLRTSDGQDEDACVYSNDKTVDDPDTTGSPYAHLVATEWSDPPAVTEYDPFDNLIDNVLPTVGNSQKVDCYGNWVDKRDAHDERVVYDFYYGTGGLISNPSEVGGYLTISAGTPCTDSDTDGMPDVFETAQFGDLSQTATGDYDSDGYNNIEEWFNGVPPQDPPASHAVIGVSIQ